MSREPGALVAQTKISPFLKSPSRAITLPSRAGPASRLHQLLRLLGPPSPASGRAFSPLRSPLSCSPASALELPPERALGPCLPAIVPLKQTLVLLPVNYIQCRALPGGLCPQIPGGSGGGRRGEVSLCWQSLGSLVPDASSCLVFSACRVASLPTPGPWRVSPTSFPPSYKKTLIPSSLPSSYCQLLPPARPHSPTPTPAQPPTAPRQTPPWSRFGPIPITCQRCVVSFVPQFPHL